ncbi:MAG: alpha/beta fold hydrolase [Planctomycetales bacterium]
MPNPSPRLFALIAVLAILNSANAAEPRDVSFISTLDKTEQRYILIPPDNFQPDAPVSILIALHGHGSDRWQFAQDPRDECRAARDAAAKHHLLYITPDYRAKTSWMGPAAEADLVQIVSDLKRQYRVRKIILTGGSMGGTAALTFSALHPDLIDGVVSMNGTANLVEYPHFQDAIAASYGGSKQDKPDEYRKRSAELHADKLTMPIAFATGGQDTLVPPASILRLHEVLHKQNRPVHLIHRPDGGHSTNYADATAAFDFVFNKVSIEPARSP